MHPAPLELVQTGKAAKGDVLGVARLVGIAAAKKTSDLIPLAHPISLHVVSTISISINNVSSSKSAGK